MFRILNCLHSAIFIVKWMCCLCIFVENAVLKVDVMTAEFRHQHQRKAIKIMNLKITDVKYALWNLYGIKLW